MLALQSIAGCAQYLGNGKARRQLLPKANWRGRLSPYIGHKVGKSGLPKSTIIANGLDSGDLGNDPCGKHSLQVAVALLGNIW